MKDGNRDRLVDILAETYGYQLPLRGFQRMAVEKIFGPQIEAILAAGWEPSGLRAPLDAVEAEHRALRSRLLGLSGRWKDRGFAFRGTVYAAELEAVLEDRST